jgi:hypothetical protein
VALTALDQGVSAFDREKLLVIEALGRPPAVLAVTVPTGLRKVADVQGLRGALELSDVTGHAFLPCDGHALMLRRFTADCDNSGDRHIRERERHDNDMRWPRTVGTRLGRRRSRRRMIPRCSMFVSHLLRH